MALVNWGTHPEQSTLVSSLANVVQDAAAAGAKPPSVIIVGEVVGLRPSNWPGSTIVRCSASKVS